ncbi:MAG: hypothetical protein ACK49V_00195 [Actinomycetes bacterium]
MDLRALLDVQRLDTAMDQARHARANLPESAVQESAAGKLATLRARIGDLLREQGTLESELAGIEKHDAEIGTHLARLEKQLKSVIAPREAEALQHEMKNLMIEREAADERWPDRLLSRHHATWPRPPPTPARPRHRRPESR